MSNNAHGKQGNVIRYKWAQVDQSVSDFRLLDETFELHFLNKATHGHSFSNHGNACFPQQQTIPQSHCLL